MCSEKKNNKTMFPAGDEDACGNEGGAGMASNPKETAVSILGEDETGDKKIPNGRMSRGGMVICWGAKDSGKMKGGALGWGLRIERGEAEAILVAIAFKDAGESANAILFEPPFQRGSAVGRRGEIWGGCEKLKGSGSH